MKKARPKSFEETPGREGTAGQVVHLNYAANRSGCVGVCRVKRVRFQQPSGERIVRWMWHARLGARSRDFSVASLGDQAAFQAAVRQRAEWEREIGQLASMRQTHRHERRKSYGRNYRRRLRAEKKGAWK